MAALASGDLNLQNPHNQFATSKSSSLSSSFSSIEQPSLDRQHHAKGMFSAQSSLGDLPPLSGSIGGSNVRNTLAPLKKSPSNSANKPLESNNTSKEKKSSGIHGTHEYIIFA